MPLHLVLSILLLAPGAAGIAVCPGEGARYQDFKCNHDETHRVCAQLLDGEGEPLNWGDGNFWQITGQEAFQWDDEIRKNHGDSWCICMWATARLIKEAGCSNVHIDCDATDVGYVMKSFSDGGVDLAPAKSCLQQKCSGAASALQRLDDASAVPGSVVGSAAAAEPSGAVPLPKGTLAGSLALLALGGFVATWSLRRRPAPSAALAQEAAEAGQAAIE